MVQAAVKTCLHEPISLKLLISQPAIVMVKSVLDLPSLATSHGRVGDDGSILLTAGGISKVLKTLKCPEAFKDCLSEKSIRHTLDGLPLAAPSGVTGFDVVTLQLSHLFICDLSTVT
jgi:hypothetical protein